MKTKDHELLAGYLLDRMDNEIPETDRRAFIKGNIWPDKNPFSYLRGTIKQEFLRGHNFGNAHAHIERLIKQVQLYEYFGKKAYFLLGNLVHYVADAFTFPHNAEFGGGLSEHCEYEDVLHRHMLENLRRKEKGVSCHIEADGLMQRIDSLHRAYLSEDKGFMHDCSYIFRSTTMVISAFFEGETIWQELAEAFSEKGCMSTI